MIEWVKCETGQSTGGQFGKQMFPNCQAEKSRSETVIGQQGSEGDKQWNGCTKTKEIWKRRESRHQLGPQ